MTMHEMTWTQPCNRQYAIAVSRWAKSCFGWKVSLCEWLPSAKLYIIFNGKVLPTQYNDLLRQITSSSSSRRSLFFDWQQYIAGVVFLFFVLYKMLYSIAFVSPFLCYQNPVGVQQLPQLHILYWSTFGPKFPF